MFNRKKKELQTLVEASRKSFKKAERENEELTKENLVLYKEKKELNSENDKQNELINKIETLLKCNKYNNEKSILNKIKELISDHQSEN